jgi:pyrroloquinoline-quinone synthase
MVIYKKKAFRDELEKALRSHLTLGHPIFLELLKGSGDSRQLMQKVALQGYQLTKHFFTYIEHLFFHCPDPGFKRQLLINAYEEETGRLSRSDNHVVLMQQFIRALGVSDADRDAEQPLPSTQELIDYRMEAVRVPTKYHIGAAAVMIASEGQNLATAVGKARHVLLERGYGLKDRDLRFFAVHRTRDMNHVELGLDLVTEICNTRGQQDEALFAVHHTCGLFFRMYDGMFRAYCPPTPSPVLD